MKEEVDFNEGRPLERRLIESFVIQALGATRRKVCKACKAGKGMYKQCRTAGDLFDGVCGNCKRRERCGECEYSAVYQEALRENLKDKRFAMRQEMKETETQSGRKTTVPAVYGR